MNEKQDHINPPRWSLRLLRLFIRKDYLEEIEGDMEEVFYDDLETCSPGKARRRYNLGVIRLLRPAIIKNIFGSQKLNYLGMLQHNLLITLRGFKRHKTTFFINLIGLSTGLAASLLIFLWVNDERSIDTFHEKNNQLYQALVHFELPAGTATWDYTPGPLAAAMLDEMPEVESAVRVGNHTFFKPRGVISSEENNFEIAGQYASDNFFQVMSYDLIVGDASTVLRDKKSVVLSKSLAINLFGNAEDAMDKTVNWNNRLFSQDFVVSGVYNDPPANATKQFDAVINYQLLIDLDKWADGWKGSYAETYLVLKEGTDIDAFNEKLSPFLHYKAGDHERFTLFVEPYSKLYLYGKYDNGVQTGGRIENVRLFSFVALFILLIACINFMNLATAQASKKMKEVGVKKAIGANRAALVAQFLGESLLLSLISFIASIGLINLILPQFNDLVDKQLEFDMFAYLQPMLIVVLVTGFLAGSYPAFYLSGFKPVAVLKGKLTNLKGEAWVRKGLVITQFVLSIIFITGVIVINKQIEFTQSKELGYDRSNVLTFSRKGPRNPDPLPFINELSRISGVESIANMAGGFLWGGDSGSGYSWEDGEEDDKYLFKSPKIGHNLIETMKIELLAGRTYSREFNDDTNIIINEAAVKLMGLENPVGTRLGYGDETREIIGVVKDFQYGSLFNELEPLIFRFRNNGSQFLIKVQPGTEATTIEQIEEIYSAFHPKYSFEASFMNDDYSALYNTESKVAVLSNYMALVAIIISSLGLLGLAAFTAERRTKEIGIRKILGASQLVIMRLLTASFTKTVIIAVIIALPIGYFLAESWLQNFAYTVDLEWWFFATAGLAALLIAWLTVGFQTFKSASINPVHCLRDE